MCLACNNKNKKVRFCLLLVSLSVIITYGFLYAQQSPERDPFISLSDDIMLARQTGDLSVLPYPVTIEAIVWTEKVKVAVLNNDIVQEGQAWKDFIVESIEKDKVTLKLGEANFEIPLVTAENDQKDKEKQN